MYPTYIRKRNRGITTGKTSVCEIIFGTNEIMANKQTIIALKCKKLNEDHNNKPTLEIIILRSIKIIIEKGKSW
jgi:hypothetical protein